MSRFLSPKLDIVFKYIFGNENNTDVLSDFLACYLDLDKSKFKSISLDNTELVPDSPEQKFGRLDVLLKTADSQIDIEIQVCNQMDYAERSLYYWSKLYSSQLQSGDEYGKSKKTIAFNIVDFKMFDCEDYHSVYELLNNKTHHRLTDKCRIDFLELTKVKGLDLDAIKDDKKLAWAAFLNAAGEEDLNMLNELDNPAIDKAVITLKEMSADEKAFHQAMLREKSIRDEISMLNFAKREGLKLGIMSVAKKLLDSGMDFNIIQQATGLDKAALLDLQNGKYSEPLTETAPVDAGNDEDDDLER